MFNKLKQIVYTVTQKYFVEVCYVPPVPSDQIPVARGHEYIKLNADGSMDYTTDVKNATCFDFILGCIIVRKLKLKTWDMPNLHFSLVSVHDAGFIDYVTSATA